MKLTDIKEKFAAVWVYICVFFKWSILALAVGALGGVVGALFSKAIVAVTAVREDNGWLLYLLPVGGVLISAIYGVLKIRGTDTNRVFESVRSGKSVSAALAPAVFASSAVTHLLGGSAGREGAALQIGGSIASGLGKMLRFDQKQNHVIITAGMSAVFAAVFGTPLCAAVFAVEVVSVGYIYSFALYPCLVSSLTAYMVSNAMGVAPEHFTVPVLPEVSAVLILRVVAVAMIGAVASMLFCIVMHQSERIFGKIKSPYIRPVVGGVIIIALTLIVGNNHYNGGGMNIIASVFEKDTVIHEAFILKMIFTAITIGSGFKGGEIVPTLFIGATLGGSLASLIGLPVPFGAAICMAALFCGVTNCPLATCLLCLELFGQEGILFYTLSAFLSFLLSGNYSLYKGQKIIFSKIRSEMVDSLNG